MRGHRVAPVSRQRAAFTVMELAVVVAMFLVVVAMLSPFVAMTKRWAHRVNCAKNIRQLSLALHAHAQRHGGAFPARLADLYPGQVKDKKAFDCPATKHIGTPDDPDYDYTASLSEGASGKVVMVRDKAENHGRAGQNILTVDGAVIWAREPGKRQ